MSAKDLVAHCGKTVRMVGSYVTHKPVHSETMITQIKKMVKKGSILVTDEHRAGHTIK